MIKMYVIDQFNSINGNKIETNKVIIYCASDFIASK